jgi:acetylornithine deacetylase/succinyl-diaminopimelate desuccinylase-like protein
MALEQVRQFVEKNRQQTLEELYEFLRIPSISAQPESTPDVRRAAEWLREALERAGLEQARLIEGEGHPLVAAEWMHAPGKPVVLFYGHYDVQPPDPLDEWLSPPFTPEQRGDNLYARGVADDKGLTLIWVKALEALLANGPLPVNVRVLCEGEEETSGHHLSAWLAEHASEIASDAVIICDTEMFAPEWPAITVGLRGLLYMELDLEGAKTDLHSGSYGGAAPNALMAAAEIVTALKDRSGRIQIPGFYDDVEPVSEAQRKEWSALPFDETRFREEEIGASATPGEPGYGVLERLWARPTMEVHGIVGGYTGDGAKTVIPARAKVKFSCRLVPRQDPNKIRELVWNAIQQAMPEGIRGQLRVLGGSPASIVDADHPFVTVAKEAMSAHFQNPASSIRTGGSIPVVGEFTERLQAPCLLLGFGLPDDNLHAPNEKLYMPNFWRGIVAVADVLQRLGEQ